MRLGQRSRDIKPKKRFLFFLRLAVCAALLAYALFRYDPSTILEPLRSADGLGLAAGWALLYVGILLSAWRWRLILARYGRKDSVLRLFGLYVESGFFNLFFPGFIVGDVSRIAGTSERGKSPLEAAVAVFLERFSGLFTICLYLAGIAVFGGYRDLGMRWNNLILAGLAAALFGLMLLLNVGRIRWIVRFGPAAFARRLDGPADRLETAIGAVISNPGLLLRLMAVSALFILASIPPAFLISRAIDMKIPVTILMAYVPLTAFVCGLPVSISGVGVRENVYLALYAAIGYSSAQSIAFGLVMSASVLMLNISGGLALLLRAGLDHVRCKPQGIERDPV